MHHDATIIHLSASNIEGVLDFWSALGFTTEWAGTGELIVLIASRTLAVYESTLASSSTSFVTVVTSRRLDPYSAAAKDIQRSGGLVRQIRGTIELRDPAGNVWHLAPPPAMTDGTEGEPL